MADKAYFCATAAIMKEKTVSAQKRPGAVAASGLRETKDAVASDLRDDGHHDGVAPQHVAEEAAQA